MGTHLAGTAGDVFVASVLLENAEDAWDVDGGATGTSAAVDTDAKVGTYSVKIVVPVGSNNGDILAHEVITSTDLITAAYTHLMYWAKSSVAINTAGDLAIGVSETEHLGGSPVYSSIPVLVANTWKYCFSTITTTGLDQVIFVGAKLVANDPGAFNLYLDDIRAGKLIAGIRSWSLDYTSDTVETTDFGSAGVKEYIISGSSWSGSFDGFKDGAPLTIGSQYGIALAESGTATQMWLGTAFITGVHPTVSHDGIVSYAYDFLGTGVLQPATA